MTEHDCDIQGHVFEYFYGGYMCRHCDAGGDCPTPADHAQDV